MPRAVVQKKISLKIILVRCEKDARETGLEPATSDVTGRCSNQLNYSRIECWAQQDSNL
jgi:hypothetical protein